MESSTARCPQCGAAIRPSARFCVTCGIKLPENTPAPGVAASGWTAREEPVSQDTDPVWAMPAPQSAPSDESDAGADIAAVASEEPIQEADAANAQQPDSESWLIWPESSTGPASSVEPFDEPEVQGEVVDLASKPSGDANASTDDELKSEAEAEKPGEPPADAVGAGEAVVDVAAIEDVESEPIGAQSFDDELPAPDVGPETVRGNASPLDEAALHELNPFDDFTSAEWESTTEPAEDNVPAVIEIDRLDDEPAREETGELIAEETESASIPSADGSIDRANALIDELRALLPALVAPAPEEPRNLKAIRDRAIAARGDVSFDRYQALRDVVQEALTRPRDVEVVLRLSRRVEDMHALISEWDRLQQAFDQLIAEME